MFDSFVQTEDMNGKNSDNPDLTPPSAAYYNLHFDLGGPIVKDKLWFFGALQYYLRQDGIYGFTEKAPYYQPRSFFKLTWQPNRDNRFSFSYEGDLYTRKYRGASLYTDPIATRHQRSPELYFNGNYLHIFSDNTFLEAKGAGYISYYKLIPNAGYDLPGHYDYGTLRSTVNAQTYYHAFRDRLAVNVSVSHHADNFIKGSHDFKFGLDSELNPCRTEWGYAGKKAYNDYYGQPYYMYAYDGYVTRAKNFRASAYVQDSWSLSDRIKINPGVRANLYRGSITGVGTVFKPQIAIAPRLGITIDPFGDHRTAIKAHWGLFYDNILSYFYNEFAPKPDWISNYWDGSTWVENYRVVWDPTKYTMDPNLKMQYMSQWTIGIERELLRDLSIGINYINRSNHNMIDRVALLDLATDFTVRTTTDPKTGQVITYYSQNNPGSEKYVVTNPVLGETWNGQPLTMIPATPTRKYHGVEFVLTKRFSDKWMLNASYVYGKARGTDDNYYNSWGSSALGQSRLFVDPNYWVNNLGTSQLSYDPTHMLKVQGMVMLPLGINLSGYFSYISGYTYNRWYRVKPAQGTRYIPMELIGTLRYPAQTNLDLKVEKVIKFDKFRLGINADVYNVFNASTIDGTNTTWSSSSYGAVTDLVYPRVFRLGLRLFF